ncbi:MAG: low-specificity L-threonine aldolase [Chloroflexi bacterium]|nr:low-specificity L-threonine aldolase [Chloroflexota bacterium]
MRIIDLRSDTVTLPTQAMRDAMYNAELGDDVYGEDPTINRLQEMAAERMGKEAALFVPSGTMGNLVSLLTHCGRGDEAIMGSESHTFYYEGGGSSALGGIHVHTVPNLPNGMMEPEQVELAIRGQNIHFPRTRLLCLENTHNRCGGAVLNLQQMATLTSIAHQNGFPVHLDGARIFNAATALGIQAREIAAQADSVQFCFSKGLAAPVGSAICSSKAFIQEAVRVRKMLGGGMRQAGVLAAAAIVALEQMVERLAEDHSNARILAEGMMNLKQVHVDLQSVQSNMVMFTLANRNLVQQRVLAQLAAEGLRVSSMDTLHLRAVTHYGINSEDIALALEIMNRVLG